MVDCYFGSEFFDWKFTALSINSLNQNLLENIEFNDKGYDYQTI